MPLFIEYLSFIEACPIATSVSATMTSGALVYAGVAVGFGVDVAAELGNGGTVTVGSDVTVIPGGTVTAGVLVGFGVAVAAGVLVGFGVAVAAGVLVGFGVAEALALAVGFGVDDDFAVDVGLVVAVALGVAVAGASVGIDPSVPLTVSLHEYFRPLISPVT